MSTFTAFRMVSAYADDPLLGEHDRAMKCRDAEVSMVCGLFTYQLLSNFEAACQADAFRDEIEPEDPVWSEIRDTYRLWFAKSEKVLESALRFQAEGFEVEQLSEFQETVGDVQCRIELWDVEPRLASFESAVPLLRPDNPRPDRYND